MANPFGIEQVDIPGLLGMHQNLQRQRIADLVIEKKMRREDQQYEREERVRGLRAKAMGGGDPESLLAAGAVDLPAGARPPVAPEPVHPVDTLAPGADLPPRTDGVKINQDALRQLYVEDPDSASAIQKFVYDGDKQALEAATQRGEAMANAALAIKATAPADRPAERERWKTFLVERGYSPEQVDKADLSDAGLDRLVRQGRTIEKVIDSGEIKYQVIPQGGRLQGFDSTGRPLDASPSPVAAPAGLEAEAEEAIRRGADPAKVRARLEQMKGGAGSGPRTFP